MTFLSSIYRCLLVCTAINLWITVVNAQSTIPARIPLQEESFVRSAFSITQSDSLGFLDSSLHARYVSIFFKVATEKEATKKSVTSSIQKEAEVINVEKQKNKNLQFGGGFLSYTYNYSSGVDTPYNEKAISQHLLNAGADITVAGSIPLRVVYFERETNSPFFKSYRDVRVSLDVAKYNQYKSDKRLKALRERIDGMRDPALQRNLKNSKSQLDRFKNWTDDAAVLSELIKSKEVLATGEFPDTSFRFRDSVITRARKFIELYDSIENKRNHFQHLYDSVATLYNNSEANFRKLEQIAANKNLSWNEAKTLSAKYGQDDVEINKSLNRYTSIKNMSVGKSMPDVSNLTIQNINVNGANLELKHQNFYMAVMGGLIDFRMRDFLYKKQSSLHQYVYAARLGYGDLARNNIILTYFGGKKQLIGGNQQQPLTFVQGVSLSYQYILSKNIKINGEVAQSLAPHSSGNIFSTKPTFRISDHSQQAYSIGFISSFFKGKTRTEGFLQHSGLHYQSFNSYQYNTTKNRWFFAFEQSLWRNQLQLTMRVRKNDFENPFLLERYNANTVYKNVSIAFHKPKYPSISLGYLPSSQYSLIDSVVYENHYQMLTGNLSYPFRIGLVKAVSSVVYSQFFNDRHDSALVYYNSRNFYWNQLLQFTKFRAGLGVSISKNTGYSLDVFEENISAVFFKKLTLGGSVKINNLNNVIIRIGYNSNARFTVRNVGEIRINIDRSFIPSTTNSLYKYEFYSVGLTRYFK